PRAVAASRAVRRALGSLMDDSIDYKSRLINLLRTSILAPSPFRKVPRRRSMMALHLEEVMNSEPAVVSPGVSLTAAAATMRARGIGSAVVVDGRSVVGILT